MADSQNLNRGRVGERERNLKQESRRNKKLRFRKSLLHLRVEVQSGFISK